MAHRRDDETDVPEDKVAGGAQIHPLAAAALIGVASAGVYLGTRALAKRHGAKDGKVSSVMATAMTATDLASAKTAREPSVASEPGVPAEPRVDES